jgi:hypothetical protein
MGFHGLEQGHIYLIFYILLLSFNSNISAKLSTKSIWIHIEVDGYNSSAKSQHFCMADDGLTYRPKHVALFGIKASDDTMYLS